MAAQLVRKRRAASTRRRWHLGVTLRPPCHVERTMAFTIDPIETKANDRLNKVRVPLDLPKEAIPAHPGL